MLILNADMLIFSCNTLIFVCKMPIFVCKTSIFACKALIFPSKMTIFASYIQNSRPNRSLSAASFLESSSCRLDRPLSWRVSVASHLAHSACMLRFLA